jgi:superfamily II DNA or RNA helicase
MSVQNCYITSRGYVVPKHALSHEDLEALKRELTITPFTPEGYGPNENLTFKTFLESSGKLYLPKYFGLQKFGVPNVIKIQDGDDIDVVFTGKLRPLQEDAVEAVLSACRNPLKMGGLLCLLCGQGKTVCGIKMICDLGKKALIVVNKEFLLEQWKERIREFAPNARIGIIKAKVIDVDNKDIVIASLQSLAMKDYDPNVLSSFGTLLADECHHLAAQVFSQALKKCNFRYSIGLTATPKRKDGLTKVFTWFIGDIAYQTKKRKDELEVRFVEYYNGDPAYSKEHVLWNKKPNMSKMINAICDFCPRVGFIVDQIKQVLKKEPNRRVLLLSDRRQHLHLIKEQLDNSQYDSGFYYGGMTNTQLKDSEDKQILLATYQYASEGFDMKGLDTLILASPKSDVIQVVGRILRDKPEDRKHIPLVIDIVDDFSMFPKQAKKRHAYYKSCKYVISDEHNIFNVKPSTTIPKGTCAILEEL